MTFKPDDPHTIACSRKGSAVDNAGRFRKGEPKASMPGARAAGCRRGTIVAWRSIAGISGWS